MIFILPSFCSLIIVCCVALFSVLFAAEQTSPSFSLSKGKGAVLQIFNVLHNYHMDLKSLLTAFNDPDKIAESAKSEGGALFLSPEHSGWRGQVRSPLHVQLIKHPLPLVKGIIFQLPDELLLY